MKSPDTHFEVSQSVALIPVVRQSSAYFLGVAQTIEVHLEEVEGGVIDINELEIRDISAQYSIHFTPLNPFSYCQKRMKIKNLT